MKKFNLIAFAAAIGIGADAQVSALAADLSKPAPVYTKAPLAEVGYDWTGFYVGGNGGGGQNSRSTILTANDPATTALFAFTQQPGPAFKSSGTMGGLQAGYNKVFENKWLLGLEADFDWSGVKGSGQSAAATPAPLPPFTASASENIRSLGTVRARLGYVPFDRLLTYATGGFAYGQLTRSASLFDAGGPIGITSPPFQVLCAASATCLAGSSGGWSTGWTVGGGFEYALWRNLSVKAEYLHVRLENNSVNQFALNFIPPNNPASVGTSFNRTELDVVRVGVNYKFNAF